MSDRAALLLAVLVRLLRRATGWQPNSYASRASDSKHHGRNLNPNAPRRWRCTTGHKSSMGGGYNGTHCSPLLLVYSLLPGALHFGLFRYIGYIKIMQRHGKNGGVSTLDWIVEPGSLNVLHGTRSIVCCSYGATLRAFTGNYDGL